MKRIPKTGLAKRIREWAQSRDYAFTPSDLSTGLDIPEGKGRARVWNAIRDFQKRGELERVENGKFRYSNDFRKRGTAPLRQKILKAVYVLISQFAVSDVQRLAGAHDRSYVRQIIRELIARNLIRPVGRRRCRYSQSVECVFSVTERDRLKIEMLS